MDANESLIRMLGRTLAENNQILKSQKAIIADGYCLFEYYGEPLAKYLGVPHRGEFPLANVNVTNAKTHSSYYVAVKHYFEIVRESLGEKCVTFNNSFGKDFRERMPAAIVHTSLSFGPGDGYFTYALITYDFDGIVDPPRFISLNRTKRQTLNVRVKHTRKLITLGNMTVSEVTNEPSVRRRKTSVSSSRVRNESTHAHD